MGPVFFETQCTYSINNSNINNNNNNNNDNNDNNNVVVTVLLHLVVVVIIVQGRLSLSTVGDKCAKDNLGGILLKI